MVSISFHWTTLSAFEVSSDNRVFLCTLRERDSLLLRIYLCILDLPIINIGMSENIWGQYLCSGVVREIYALETPPERSGYSRRFGRRGRPKAGWNAHVQRVDAPEMSGADSLLNGAYVSESVLKIPTV